MGKMSDVAIAIEEGGWEPIEGMWGFYRNQEGQMATFMQIATDTVPKLFVTNPFGGMLP